MEKPRRTGAQVYGYSVCLVCVITFLIAITSFVQAVINLTDPLHSGWNSPGSPSLASYENYKMDVLRSGQGSDGNSKTVYQPDDATLRKMYEAAKNDKIQLIKHQSNGNMIVSGLIILICTVLFLTHWRWMKRLAQAES